MGIDTSPIYPLTVLTLCNTTTNMNFSDTYSVKEWVYRQLDDAGSTNQTNSSSGSNYTNSTNSTNSTIYDTSSLPEITTSTLFFLKNSTADNKLILSSKFENLDIVHGNTSTTFKLHVLNRSANSYNGDAINWNASTFKLSTY